MQKNQKEGSGGWLYYKTTHNENDLMVKPLMGYGLSLRSTLGNEVLEQVAGTIESRELVDVLLDDTLKVAVLADLSQVKEGDAEVICLLARGFMKRHPDATRHCTSKLSCSNGVGIQAIHCAVAHKVGVVDAVNVVQENLANLGVGRDKSLRRKGEAQLEELEHETVTVIDDGNVEGCIKEQLENRCKLVVKSLVTHRCADELKQAAERVVEGIAICVAADSHGLCRML